MASHTERQIVHVKDVFEVAAGTGSAVTSESHGALAHLNAPIVAGPGDTTPPLPQPQVIGASATSDVVFVTNGKVVPSSALKENCATNSAEVSHMKSTSDQESGLDNNYSKKRPAPKPPGLAPSKPCQNSGANLPKAPKNSQTNGGDLSHSSAIIDNNNSVASGGRPSDPATMAHVGTAKQLAKKGNVHSSKSPHSSQPHHGSLDHVNKSAKSSDMTANKDFHVSSLAQSTKPSAHTAHSKHVINGNNVPDKKHQQGSEKESDYVSSIGSAYCQSEASGTTSSASGYYSESVAGSETQSQKGVSVLDTSTMRKSHPLLYGMDNEDEDDDGFAEDECTLDFDDDDLGQPGEGDPSQTRVYREYYGEDFAQYLEDDPVEPSDPNSRLPHELSQYARPRKKVNPKQKHKRKTGSSGDPLAESSDDISQASRSSVIKNRISQVFTLGRSHGKNKQRDGAPLSKIYDFSYTDSKIGHDVKSKSNGASSDSTSTSTSSRQGRYKKKTSMFESRSDFGTLSNTGSWWNSQEVLDNGTRDSQSEIMTSSTPKSKSSSVPNLLKDKSIQSNGSLNGNKKSSSSSSSSKNKNTLWRRFSRSLRKGDKVEYVVDDDLVSNNLQSASSFEDIRL